MSDYSSLYVTATGEIIEVAETAELSTPDGSQSVYAGPSDPDTQYILAGALTDRPTITDQTSWPLDMDGTDSVSLSVPSGTVVTDLETGLSQTAASADTLTITSTTVALFEVLIEPPFPYVPVTIRIAVNAPDNR